MAKNDLQGALDLLILKTLSQLDRCTGTASSCIFAASPMN